jgi:hypothetical protein
VPKHGLYSDPFLAKLIAEQPDLALRFFEKISLAAVGSYGWTNRLAKCLETPVELLSTLGKEAFENPNFPRHIFEEYLSNSEKFTEAKWYIFNSPLLTPDDVSKFFHYEDLDVRARALAHKYGDSHLLLQFVKSILDSTLQAPASALEYVCRMGKITDDLFTTFGPYLERKSSEYSNDRIGDLLSVNSSLSEEHRAFLTLSGFNPKPSSLSDYTATTHYLSSLIWFPLFKDLSLASEIEKLGEPDFEIISALSKYGHPYSLLNADELSTEFVISVDAFYELNETQFLHRLFWTELCERSDFEIYRRNAYRTDDVFIKHPILGRQFEDSDYEKSFLLGGVFGYNYQTWLKGTEELDINRAAELSTAHMSTMLEYVEEGWSEDFGMALCGFVILGEIDSEAYGFSLTDASSSLVISKAEEFAEPDDFDVSAELNPDFGEILSWSKTPDSKKKAIFDLLVMGRNIPIETKQKADSNHFLGCMALHESTPDFLIKELAALNDPLINGVIASR